MSESEIEKVKEEAYLAGFADGYKRGALITWKSCGAFLSDSLALGYDNLEEKLPSIIEQVRNAKNVL